MEGSSQSSLSEEDNSSKEHSLPEEENDLQSEWVLFCCLSASKLAVEMDFIRNVVRCVCVCVQASEIRQRTFSLPRKQEVGTLFVIICQNTLKNKGSLLALMVR